ncbi:winged helix-turn-helix domain-containing protein [Methanonatronarchaeum sp. AMET6-2]|uniref:winged helix-turn-helix domain-containing protein n=1 Tax=Methanonatronarchaeum sp. AMET6-2 TaxID=2933293 RepID=UPI001FF28FE8|nr:winged helix-turn-helix domain-containing protein [Methanonatronarchaeum sp. AMET6-2]UOY10011.1 winged helix-turn-helix domain-containing protein [Methanonatronarchaeum sp. AMET6-2]
MSDPENIWDLMSFLKTEIRTNTLRELEKSPKTPKDISKSIGKSLPQVSRTISELKHKGLVECKNPEASKNRYYQIKEKGKEALRQQEKISGEN